MDYNQAVKRHDANLLLQMLLQANVYASFLWAVSYLIHMLCFKDQLWNWQGFSMLLAFALASTAEAGRLYAGYAANLGNQATAMWLLLTLTPFVLLPALLYLRLVALTQLLWLQLLSSLMFLLIALELIVAIVSYTRGATPE